MKSKCGKTDGLWRGTELVENSRRLIEKIWPSGWLNWENPRKTSFRTTVHPTGVRTAHFPTHTRFNVHRLSPLAVVLAASLCPETTNTTAYVRLHPSCLPEAATNVHITLASLWWWITAHFVVNYWTFCRQKGELQSCHKYQPVLRKLSIIL